MSEQHKQNILVDSEIKVYVKQDEHANQDSLPLRFGFFFPENKVLELFDCKEQSTDNNEDKVGIKYRLKASFKDVDENEHSATFIILDNSRNYPIVKTLWMNDFYAEDKLSEYLKSLRKKNEINPDFLVGMHPYYINGEANTVEGFISVLANLNFDKDKKIISITKEKEKTQKDNKELKNEVKDLTEEISQIKEKLHNKNTEEIRTIRPKNISIYEHQDKYPDIGKIANKVTKIYGPPGTGKTTTLINLVKENIKNGIKPDEIGFFSFTNFSINVAKKRIVEAFPHYDLDRDFTGFRTLHSVAYQTLKTNLNILDKEQALSFDEDFKVEERYLQEDDISSLVLRSKHPVVDTAAVARAKMISLREHLENLLPGDDYFLNKWLKYPSKNCDRPVYKEDFEIIIRYNELFEEYKKSIGVIDYTAIIEKGLEQDKSIPQFKVIFVDEAQDFSKLEWTFIEKLFRKTQHIYMAGDDDQAISESTGASAQIFVDYKFDEEIVLNQSYRIPPKIHESLFEDNGILSILNKFNPFRKEKNWNAKIESAEGMVYKIHLNELLDLVTKNHKKEWLIMSATNATIQKFSSLLISKKQSHILSNRIMPDNNYGEDILPSIRLATIWGAKGDEADCTVLLRDNFVDETMMARDPRLKYVAQTRAKFLHFESSEKYYSSSQIDISVFKTIKNINVLRNQAKEPNNPNESIPSSNEFKTYHNKDNDKTSDMTAEIIHKTPNNVISDIEKELEIINEPPFNGEFYKHNVSKLLDVIYCKRGRYDGVELIMEDGTKRAKIFGNIPKTYEVASKLKGHRIYTDVANPSKNSDREWFKNIFIFEEL